MTKEEVLNEYKQEEAVRLAAKGKQLREDLKELEIATNKLNNVLVNISDRNFDPSDILYPIERLRSDLFSELGYITVTLEKYNTSKNI